MSDPAELLTHRQVDVVRAMVAGHTSNREVGAVLGISAESAKGHVSNILKVLGLADRTSIALWALRENRARWDPRARYRPLAAVDHGHRYVCPCSVCYVHRVLEPREARERARRVA